MFDTITLSRKGQAQVLVIGQFKGEQLDKKAAALDPSGAASVRCSASDATGEPGSIIEAFPMAGKGAPATKGKGFERILIVGMGEKGALKACGYRVIAASIGRKLAAIKATSVRIDLSSAIGTTGVDAHDAGSAFGEGLGILGWVCDEFRGSATTLPKRPKLSVQAAGDGFEAGVERGLGLAEGTNLCRTLSQTPPNIATPAYMASVAKRLARECGLRCTVVEGEGLVREKCAGLINVGKASENLPCLIRLEYTGSGARGGKPVVLVGKTMTYDTGGLSLKVNNGMVGMKRDKDGGCAVLGAMHAISTVIKPRQRVIAYLVAAENSISDEAYRPDDVLTFRNGVTVEVTNTDAEGRLVLADALCIACEKDDPACIIDVATLTGGVITALGSTYAGMFCDDDALRARVEQASQRSGERVWRLPMHQEYRDMMKSPIADIVNSNPNRKAHAGQGAAFLSYFVKPKVPWCHLDIAGVHVAEKNAGMFVDGPTGWGVRLLAEFMDR